MSIFTTTIYGEKMRKKQIYVTLCLIALAIVSYRITCNNGNQRTLINP